MKNKFSYETTTSFSGEELTPEAARIVLDILLGTKSDSKTKNMRDRNNVSFQRLAKGYRVYKQES
jgi:hypothetical protein